MRRVVEGTGKRRAPLSEAVAQQRYAERGLIASICMVCGDVYGIRSAEGSAGGLSHGWCSNVCAEAGAARAGLPRRRVS